MTAAQGPPICALAVAVWLHQSVHSSSIDSRHMNQSICGIQNIYSGVKTKVWSIPGTTGSLIRAVIGYRTTFVQQCTCIRDRDCSGFVKKKNKKTLDPTVSGFVTQNVTFSGQES